MACSLPRRKHHERCSPTCHEHLKFWLPSTTFLHLFTFQNFQVVLFFDQRSPLLSVGKLVCGAVPPPTWKPALQAVLVELMGFLLLQDTVGEQRPAKQTNKIPKKQNKTNTNNNNKTPLNIKELSLVRFEYQTISLCQRLWYSPDWEKALGQRSNSGWNQKSLCSDLRKL